MCFDYAIAIKQDALALSEGGLFFLILHPWHQAEGHSCRSKFSDFTLLMSMIWQVVTRIGVQKVSAFRVQKCIKTGNKHFRWDVLMDDIVDTLKHLPWTDYSLSNCSKHTSGSCHQKRGWHTLISHVSYHKTQSAVVQINEVIKIPTYLPGSMVIIIHFPTR